MNHMNEGFEYWEKAVENAVKLSLYIKKTLRKKAEIFGTWRCQYADSLKLVYCNPRWW